MYLPPGIELLVVLSAVQMGTLYFTVHVYCVVCQLQWEGEREREREVGREGEREREREEEEEEEVLLTCGREFMNGMSVASGLFTH